MKKLTRVILSAIMILDIFFTSGIAVSAKTSRNYYYSTTENGATITGFKGSAIGLIIPSQLDGYCSPTETG